MYLRKKLKGWRKGCLLAAFTLTFELGASKDDAWCLAWGFLPSLMCLPSLMFPCHPHPSNLSPSPCCFHDPAWKALPLLHQQNETPPLQHGIQWQHAIDNFAQADLSGALRLPSHLPFSFNPFHSSDVSFFWLHPLPGSTLFLWSESLPFSVPGRIQLCLWSPASDSQGNRNKRKTKQMGPNQTCKFLHSRRNCKMKRYLQNGRKHFHVMPPTKV